MKPIKYGQYVKYDNINLVLSKDEQKVALETALMDLDQDDYNTISQETDSFRENIKAKSDKVQWSDDNTLELFAKLGIYINITGMKYARTSNKS